MSKQKNYSGYELTGIRPGEKLHEQMIGVEDSFHTYEYQNYFKILPTRNDWNTDPKRIGKGKKVKPFFTYTPYCHLKYK